jgi:D-alanyl-D-alanine dipeptidase
MAPPPSPTADQAALVGEYAGASDTLSLLEREGALWLFRWGAGPEPLARTSDSTYATAGGASTLQVDRGAAEGPSLRIDGRAFRRITLGGVEGESFRITPVRPVGELRAEALAARPPAEEGAFEDFDLAELVALDPTIRLDVRYATTNNFMGEVFYTEGRAFLQRPAAEALVRAHRALADRGYGLLIHDGYRPWYVTRMFWDATPEPLRIFVADPSLGSRHNRGCAVDLTLFDLSTGLPVEMPGGYDEMSPRSFPDYPGGTTRQRWHRELLRQAMEAQGFTVYEAEWWHFDYKDWRSYRIGNQRFEEIAPAPPPAGRG